MQNPTQTNITPIQLKLPLDIERLIDPTDPVYTFNEVVEHVGLGKYVAQEGAHKKGRRGYAPVMLLKVILFAFMEKGYAPHSAK